MTIALSRGKKVIDKKKFLYWLTLDEGETVNFSDLAHLIAAALYHGEHEMLAYGAARVNLNQELAKAVRDGHLTVRNPAGLGLHTFPHGEALKRAVLIPNIDLEPFLNSRGIGLCWRSSKSKPRGFGPANQGEQMKIGSELFEQRKRDFWEWHEANPKVWEYFERFSLEIVASGRNKVSHWLIINRIRWEVYFETTGDEFKISNDYIAFYARLWRDRHPEHKDLFTIKHMIGEPSHE